MDHRATWEKIIEELRTEISRANLITWFRATAIIGSSDGSLTVAAPTALAERQLAQKFHTQILAAAQKIMPEIQTIVYRVEPKLEFKDDDRAIAFATLQGEVARKRKLPNKAEVKVGDLHSIMLDGRYTLDNFIVGPDNRLAHAAAIAVGKEPGQNYNPLFIYGGTGMGKTHLLHGIGNAIERHFPGKSIIYQTSETFTNELISLLRNQKAEKFKEKYRKADVLLIDDVQFFKKKEATQEEFFHTFNALYSAHKQIVITADRPPKELAGLEDRLISRFEQGMVVDVQLPDYETRVAILQEKCHEKGIMLPTDVIDFIAENALQSVRELEGVLLQAIAESELEKSTPTIRSVAKYLQKTNRKKEIVGHPELDDTPVNNTPLRTLHDLADAVANFYGTSEMDLRGPSRRSKISTARQISMYLARENLGFTLDEIGEFFGQRDHSTVMHSVQKIKDLCQGDRRFLKNLNALRKEIRI